MRRKVQDFLGEAVGREAISFFDANKLTNRRSLFFYDTVHIMSGHWKEDGEALEIERYDLDALPTLPPKS